MCWELYQKKRATKSYPARRDLVDRGVPPSVQSEVQQIISVQNAGLEKGLKDFSVFKRDMDEALLSGDISAYSSYEVKLRGPVSVVATGAISPNRLLDNTSLQALHDPKLTVQSLAFGTDVHPGGSVSSSCGTRRIVPQNGS